MKERLVIKNFGPIKSVELELGRFNVLIGEQGTGKSTVAKVLTVCQYFSYIIFDELLPNAFEEGLNSRGLSEFIQGNSYISYECEHYSFVAERGLKKETDIDQQDGSVIAEYEMPVFFSELNAKSKEFENLLKELEAIKPKQSEGHYFNFEAVGWTIPASFFQNDVAAVLDNPFYVPTERGLQSIFSLGKNSIQNLSDALFNQLAELDQIARVFKKETKMEPLEITYKNENGQGYVKSKKHDFLSLYNAASGYQSTIPVVLLIKYYSELKKKSKTFIIEEPELNLFPVIQHRLVQYLVEKTINYGNNILLTTHSPYILASLNNLMEAYKAGKIDSEITDKIVPQKYWLNPDDVSAYVMLSDGHCEDIFDREEGLIEAEKIDDVSNILNEQFTSLLNLEFAKDELNTR